MTRARVVVAGATGSTGRAVAEGVLEAADLDLVGAVARRAAGGDLATAWGASVPTVPVFASVAEALEGLASDGGVDVVVDYTSHDVVLDNTLAALRRGSNVVIGTSGLTADDFATIADAAAEAGRAVVAAGNFSLTAALAQAAALLVAPYLPYREIVDYASAGKADAPSGTARELADRLTQVGSQAEATGVVPIDQVAGARDARGATIGATQVHSVRLPSFAVSTEVVFALPDERLSIRHDAGSSAKPYVGGTLLAVRAATRTTGLVRGLDTLLLQRQPQQSR